MRSGLMRKCKAISLSQKVLENGWPWLSSKNHRQSLRDWGDLGKWIDQVLEGKINYFWLWWHVSLKGITPCLPSLVAVSWSPGGATSSDSIVPTNDDSLENSPEKMIFMICLCFTNLHHKTNIHAIPSLDWSNCWCFINSGVSGRTLVAAC